MAISGAVAAMSVEAGYGWHTAVAFALLAINQLLATFLGAGDELTPYTYVLRVLGFLLILLAIVDKNVFNRRGTRPLR